MEFSKEYFWDEVRDGFYVSGIMKRSLAAQMEVLGEIDKVCKRHNIRWFADCGTLLGAVRHGGVIPWDDDVDIAIPLKDYFRFQKIFEHALKNKKRPRSAVFFIFIFKEPESPFPARFRIRWKNNIRKFLLQPGRLCNPASLSQ